jgi:hypothetical protein
MALLAKVLYDFSSDKSSAADDDDFHVVLLILMVARCWKFSVCASRRLTRHKISDSESIRSSLPLDQMPGALSLLQVLSVSKGRNGIAWLGVTGKSCKKMRCRFQCGLAVHGFAARNLYVLLRERVWCPVLSNITNG